MNSRDPERVAAAYTEDSQWRNERRIFGPRPEAERGQSIPVR